MPDYDEAIDYFVNRPGFALLEDTQLAPHKRWVRVAPKDGGLALLLVEAPRQEVYGKVCVFEDAWGNRWDLIEAR